MTNWLKNAYVAVAPHLGQMTSLILPYANTKMMNLFLKQVSQEFAEYFIIMQVYKAAWHLSKSLQIPANIRLLPQPSHSSELLPVEYIWEDIRENSFYNRILKSMDSCGGYALSGFYRTLICSRKITFSNLFPSSEN
jgi:hypothetical protein